MIKAAYPPLKKIFHKHFCSPDVNLFLPYPLAMLSQLTRVATHLNKKIENKIDLFHQHIGNGYKVIGIFNRMF